MSTTVNDIASSLHTSVKTAASATAKATTSAVNTTSSAAMSAANATAKTAAKMMGNDDQEYTWEELTSIEKRRRAILKRTEEVSKSQASPDGARPRAM